MSNQTIIDLLVDESSTRTQLLELRESLLIQLRQVNARLGLSADRDTRRRQERELPSPKVVAREKALA